MINYKNLQISKLENRILVLSMQKNTKQGFSIVLLALIFLISMINCAQQISIGKLTVLSHSSKTAINKTILLKPLSYHEHLPNLQMLRIRVVKADPYDACTAINVSKIFPPSEKAYPDTFLLVDGQNGACNYWKKAQIANQAMVKGVIIVDDDPDKNANRPADYSEGLFLSFLITPKDAKIIMPGQGQDFQAKLRITQSSKSQQKKKVTLWLSSLNAESYDFLNWWNQTLYNVPELQNKVDWQPKYVFYGKSNDQSKHVYSCICNGLFCSPQYYGKTADALVKQDLRQKLIFKQYPDKFLTYIKLFTQRCLQKYLQQKYVQECSKTQMINAKIDQYQINTKVYNFQNKCDEDAQLFGQLLADKGRFSMIGSYPIILLNRQILQITTQSELQAAVCRKLSLQESQGCIQNYRITVQQIIISIVFFLLILAGLFGVGFFVVMCYKNKLRKQMNKQVKMQVSTAVQHYFQLSQENASSSKN